MNRTLDDTTINYYQNCGNDIDSGYGGGEAREASIWVMIKRVRGGGHRSLPRCGFSGFGGGTVVNDGEWWQVLVSK